MFLSPKEYKSLGTLPSPGCYATLDNPYDWENCREEFSKHFKLSDSGFLFSLSPGQAESVASFIYRTENILNLPEHSSFARTNHEEILCVNLHPFWRQDFIKCSLFTILLRCGRCYNLYKDEYESTLFSEWQIAETRNAVFRFLFGYTKYVPRPSNSRRHYRHGWHWIFKNMSEREVRKRLVSPGDRPSICFAGNKSLWV